MRERERERERSETGAKTKRIPPPRGYVNRQKNRKRIESSCMMKNYDVIVTFERQMSLVYNP